MDFYHSLNIVFLFCCSVYFSGTVLRQGFFVDVAQTGLELMSFGITSLS